MSASTADQTTATLAPSSNQEQQLVVFHVGPELYGVDIGRVHEIIRLQTVTRVPRAPSYVEGVINLRGKVIPVVDLRRRFGLPTAEHTRASRIVVVDVGEQVVGMIVDAVNQVVRLDTATVEAPGAVVTGADNAYVQGIAKLTDRLVLLLDLDGVFSREDRRALDAA